jgi:hypothetical protein
MPRAINRRTQDDKAIRRLWAFAVLAVLAIVVTSTLTFPAYPNVSRERLGCDCSDNRAGEAVARLIETAQDTKRRLLHARPVVCPSGIETR